MHLAEDTDETSAALNAQAALAPEVRAPPGGDAEDGAAPDAAGPEAGAGAREEYLTFRLAAQDFALAIAEVREVLRCPPITEVPRAPADVLGVVSVRGEVIAVVDPRRRLGLSQPPPGPGRLVVVDAGDGPCGLLVDAIASVVRVRPGSLEPAGAGAPACLAGVGRDRARAFAVIELAALLGPPSRPVAERATAEALDAARLRALVVDDSDASRAELARIAAEGGLEVVGEAADGEEALAKALRLEPEVVLLDLEMPRMDGFTFLRMLLANRPTIVIVVSSQSRRPDVFRALELGALEFVAKPDGPGAAPAFREALLERLRLARALRPIDEQPRP